MSRWWRAYEDAVDDPKLQQVGLEMVGAWFNLVCISSRNGGRLPSIGHTAFSMRVSEAKASALIARLVSAGLFDKDGDTFVPHNWKDRQFMSDVTDPTNAARQKRFRNAKRNANSNGRTVTESVTDPVTNTVTFKRP
jgi:hypothetical protein